MAYIYKVTNKVNGKIYIGKTIRSIRARWNAHVSSSFRPDCKEYEFKFHRAIRKYGTDAFKIEIIDDVEDANEANLREQHWISFYDSIKNGYNTTYGGEGSVRYSDEFILSCLKSGIKYEDLSKKYGMSRNTLMTRSKTLTTEEERVERKRRNLIKANGTPVYQYDLNGKYVGFFYSVQDARRKTGINHIDAVARGVRRQSGGYQWSYEKADRMSPYKSNHAKHNAA